MARENEIRRFFSDEGFEAVLRTIAEAPSDSELIRTIRSTWVGTSGNMASDGAFIDFDSASLVSADPISEGNEIIRLLSELPGSTEEFTGQLGEGALDLAMQYFKIEE